MNFLVSRWLDSSPLEIYWVACLHDFKDEAERAARASLGHKIPGATCEEMRVVPAIHYHRILEYRVRSYSRLISSRQGDFSLWLANGGSAFWVECIKNIG